ncbi:nhr-8 [Pristionchus pacificus]|uniref:Nuclear receptor n=1 Tax=Pristionchus pacificus TaxID=54126 RepID=A0A8R1ZCA4_PRIPA|nr:nhr-8 [Pristionchus pacificus]
MDEAKSDFDTGRICTICGAKALGYNFGVISCESCKAFFRRNAFKDEIKASQGVQCPFANSCTINEKSRRFCQACRLAKCYKAGMKRDWSSQGKVKKEDDADEEAIVLRKRVREWKPSIPVPPTDPTTRPMTAAAAAAASVAAASIPSIFPASPSASIPMTSMSDQVTIPKDVFMQLIHHAQCKSKVECSCKCSCGFYPPETRLIAKTDKTTNGVPLQPPPSIVPLLSGPLSVPGLEAFSPLMNPSLDLFQNVNVPGMWTPPNLWQESLSHLSNPPSNNGMSSTTASCYAPSPLVNYRDTIANPSSVQSIPPMEVVPTTPQTLDNSPLVSSDNEDEFSKNFAAIGRNPAVYEKLTVAHRSLLIELLRANESLRMPLADQKKDVYTLLDAVKCAEIAVRRMIMMAKNLKAFNELENLDQMTLIKGGSMEMMILRGAMIYDPHNRAWKYDLTKGTSEDSVHAQMVMSLDILKGSEHFLAHHQFLASFDDRIRTNEVLMMVINAIILFTPDRVGLKNPGDVRAANEKYYDLILRILECEFSSTTSREMLIRIETVIKQLKSLNTSMMEVVYGIDSSQLDPLIVEVFDIKPKNSP